MKRILLLIGLALFGACAFAQTAISLPSYISPSGASVPYWIPTDVTVYPSGAVSFCVYGYISKAAYTGGSQPFPGARHCYSSQSGANQGVIPPATYTANWPSTLTIGGMAAAAVSTAMAVTDIQVAGTQNLWMSNWNVPLNTVIYDGAHFQKATTAGWTGSSSAPTWNQSGGTTAETCGVTNGCVVWTDQGASLAWVSFFTGGSVTN